ncbi:hypothetical protein Mapa_016886 [Marchantia paleacea]|nr:hypothetical protein Mapa_016886 [Marchantia paleacea]
MMISDRSATSSAYKHPFYSSNSSSSICRSSRHRTTSCVRAIAQLLLGVYVNSQGSPIFIIMYTAWPWSARSIDRSL